MKKLLFFVLLIFFTLQSPVFGQSINFKIKGIGIGSSYAKVLKSLGKPVSSKKGGIVPCSDGSTLLILRYQGLVIELSNEDLRKFTIFSMKITSPKWSLSGINIGSHINDLKTKFGQPYHQTTESGLQALHYNNNKGISGAVSFYLQGNKVKKIELYLNYC